MLGLAVLLALVAGAVYLLQSYIFGYWNRRNIPQLSPSFPFGNWKNVFLANNSAGDTLRSLYEKTKQHAIVGIYIALRPFLLVNDAQLVKDIMVRDFQHFTDRGLHVDEERDPLSGHLFSLAGEKWKHLRSKLSPTFTSGRLKGMFQTLVDTGEVLQQYIGKRAERGEVVEIREILARYNTDNIASVAFGIQIDSINNPDEMFRHMGRKVFEPSVMNNVRGMLNLFMPTFNKYLKLKSVDGDVEKFMIGVVKDTLEYREKNNVSRKDMMQLLLQLRNTGTVSVDERWDVDSSVAHKSLTLHEVAAQAHVFFLAGYETSSTTMSFCLYELARNPDIQRKVQQEVDDVLARHGGQLTYDNIMEMKYLESCIDETLRYYPPVPFLNRDCTKEYIVPGTKTVIEKGTPILLPIYALHHDAKYFPNPEKFDPDRFANPDVKNLPYYPFGEGPRICIGLRMGKIQTKVGLSLLLSKFSFTLQDNTELVMNAKSFIMQPTNGIHVKVTKRTNYFWSTIIYNRNAYDGISSFTRHAIPSYLSAVIFSVDNERFFSIYTDIQKAVLKVICRIITRSESPGHWFEKEYFSDLLHKNNIVSIPLLLELVTIYGADNKKLISKMLQIISKQQKEFTQDLKQGLSMLKLAFSTIQQHVHLYEELSRTSELKNLTIYALDCSSTLALLLEVYHPATELCAELDMEKAISTFYVNGIVPLYQALTKFYDSTPHHYYLNCARAELVAAFRAIVNLHLDTIVERPAKSLPSADRFVSVLLDCQEDTQFVDDYRQHYNIMDDIYILQHTDVDDGFKFKYLQKVYSTVATAPQNGPDADSADDADHGKGLQSEEMPIESNNEDSGSQNQAPEDQNEKLIKEVLDVLPYLEKEYVRKVLSRYDNAEQAISAILEGNLPPDLETAPFIPPDPLDTFFEQTGIDRLNIYDGDEFDVLVHDKVKGVIKKGKGMPGQPKTLNELLDDKSHVQEMRLRYQEYSMVCDEYDDEYDDTYEAMADSESKRNLRKAYINTSDNDDDEDDLDQDENDTEGDRERGQHADRKPLDFCVNPELIRKANEERNRSKFMARHGNSHGVRQAPADVVGKPKGQGQDQQVLNNRRHKGENKSSRANHNRKQGAASKRNRGFLGPS